MMVRFSPKGWPGSAHIVRLFSKNLTAAVVHRFLVYKSFVGELAMHLRSCEVDGDAEASSEARQQIKRMILDKVCPVGLQQAA